MLYREYPEKSFKSFSLLANALPVGIPAEGLGSGILQLGVECFSRTDLPPILRESFFLKDIFRDLTSIAIETNQIQIIGRVDNNSEVVIENIFEKYTLNLC